MTPSEIADLLKQRTGLDSESIGVAAIMRAVRGRMAQCGLPGVQQYSRHLLESDEELQQLIEAVVVPETWFFRDHEAFAALVHLVRNEWLPRHPDGILRVLSIPCSTGEEPYSIVMALLDGGVQPQRFRVDAMDISHRALEHAEQAVYRKNSFRSQDLGFRTRYFIHQPDGYHLAKPVRDQVCFQYGNLLTLEHGAKSYDVIFCRNLLIYFDTPTQEATVAKLEGLLDDNGVLFVGPAEAFLVRRGKLTPLKQPRTFAFQKTIGKKDSARNDALWPQQPPRAAARNDQPKVGRLRKVQPVARPSVKPPVAVAKSVKAAAPENQLEVAGRLADAGRLVEAAAMCEAHIKSAGASAAAYYLLALTRDALGDYQGASDCYRKALYLQPDHAEALAHLSLLLEKQGDRAGARRLQQRGRRAEERMKGANT